MNEQEKLLDEFAAALLAERGISDEVPDEVREKMKKEILERLNNFFIARVLEILPEEKIIELDKLIQEKEPNEVWNYIIANIDNFNNFSMEVMADFRNKYLAI